MHLLLVMVGGSLGAMARVYVTESLSNRLKIDVLRATIIINSLGTFCLGFLLGFGLKTSLSLYLLMAVGFLGGFTTFSTFQLEIFMLQRQKNYLRAYGTLIVATLIGLMLVYTGFESGVWCQLVVKGDRVCLQ